MDFINIGSIGFAQVGSEDYYTTRRIERDVIYEFIQNDKRFKIPEQFSGMCHLAIKSFDHDFGSYDELVLKYNENILEQWAYDEDENDEEGQNVAFWAFVNSLESIDFETEELMNECKKRYDAATKSES